MIPERSGVLSQHKPFEVRPYLHTEVRGVLERANCKEPNSASITFTLPADSHVLPLFGREMFTQLVTLHNAHPFANRYIAVETLMAFDPDINTMRKKLDDGTVIYGEDIVSHELRHYITQQSFKKNQHKPTEIGFSFYWKRVEDDYILCCKAAVEDDMSLPPHARREVYMAPINPSWADVRAYYQTYSVMNPTRHIGALPIARSNTEVDIELLDRWLYKNRYSIDSRQFHFNKI